MATPKQYELLFLLKAQMDSAFSSGFTSARGYVSQLQTKVNEYNQTLRDISAYQKQKAALDTLTQKYNTESQKLTELKAKIEENGKATKAQANEKERLEKSVESLNQKVEAQKQKVEADSQALEKAKVDVNNLKQAEEELRAKAQETTAEMERFAELRNGISDFANTFTTLKMGADMAASAVGAVDKAVISCIQSAAELQYTMSAVQAVSGATQEETTQLTSLAKEMGANTIYTASQCAESLETMALAGMDVQEMMSGLPAVVNLAAASGEDLTTMCSIVSDSLNAFGLSGEKAVNEFADTLAKAATSSNTTVAVMGESLSYVESTAANLGYSIQDVSVALAEMANNALKGSVSGSALNTMLTRMSGANQTAANEMEALGLSMYNVDGTAKDLMTFMDELRESFQGFGDDAQAAQVSAYKLAGQRGMRGLLSIVNASDEEWQKMIEDVYAYEGAASSISDIRLDNYTGQIYLMESAWDALKTTIGEAFLPVGTDAAGLLTDLANGVNDFAQEHQELIVVLSAGVTAFGVTAAGISAVGTAAFLAKTMIEGLGLSFTKTLATAGAIGAAIAGVSMFATGMYLVTHNADAASDAVKEFAADVDDSASAADAAVSNWESVSSQYDDQRAKALNLIDTLDSLRGKTANNADAQKKAAAIIGELNSLMPDLNLEYDKSADSVSMTTEELQKFANMATNNEVNDKLAALAELEAAAQKANEDYKKAEAEWGNATVFSGNSAQLKETYQTAKEAAEQAQQAYEEAKRDTEEFTKAQREAAQEAADAAGMQVDSYMEMEEAALAYGEAWKEASDEAYSALSGQISLFEEAKEAQEISLSEMKGNLESYYEQYRNYNDNLQTILDSGISIPDGMWSQLTDGSSEAMGAVESMASSIKNGNVDAVNEVVGEWNKVNEQVEAASEAIGQGMEDVRILKENFEDAMNLSDTGQAEAARTVGQGIVQGLMDGMSNTEAVRAAGVTQGDSAVKGVAEGAQTHSASKATTDTGKNVDQGLIDGMNAKKEEIKTSAKNVAEAATDSFKTTLAQSKFYTYGQNAMQGAINGAESKRSSLIAKFASLGRAAAQAYQDAQDINSPSKLFYYYSQMDAEGAIRGAEDSKKDVDAAMAAMGSSGAEAYAMAVDPRLLSAISGIQTRPEAEPITAISNTTQRQTNNAPIQLMYNPQININGGASGITAEEIKRQLREHEGELYDQLVKLMEQREAANRRRAY